MKRPFAVIGITFLCALSAACIFGMAVSLTAAGVLAAAAAVSLLFPALRKQKTIPAALATAAAAFFAFFLAFSAWVLPVQAIAGQSGSLTGVMTETPYESYGKFYYQIETEQVGIEGAPQKIKVMLISSSPIDADFYDEITCNASFYSAGETSAGRYYSKGIYILASAAQGKTPKVTQTAEKPFYYYVLCVRRAVTEHIYEYMPSEEASLANALLMGDKYNLDRNLKEDFNHSGTGHLIVVSGLHMAVIQSCVYFLLIKLTRKKKLAAGLSIAGIFAFMALTAFTPSVVRSGVMLIVYMLAQMLGRSADSLNSIGIAALVLTICNPLAAGDVGLLMSFAATLGIILFYPAADKCVYEKLCRLRFLKRPLHFVASTLLVSLCATVTTFPIMLLVFRSFSVYFLLSNLMLVWAAQLLLTCCLIMVTLSFTGVFSFLAWPFAFLSTVVAAYMIQTAVFLAKLPYAYISIDEKFILIWFASTLLLAAIGILINRGFRPVKYIVPLSLAVLLCGCTTFVIFQEDAVSLRIFDSGDGISAVLEKNGNTAILASGGSTVNSPLLWYMEDKSASPDFMLIASGSRLTRYAGDLANEFDVKTILLYDTSSNQTLRQDLEESTDHLETFQQKKRVLLWDDVTVETAAINGNVWTFVQTKQGSALICPGGGSFADIPESWRSADICVLSQPPEAIWLLKAGCTVIAGSDSRAPLIAQALAPYQEKLTAPATGGDVVIQLYRQQGE